MSAIRSKILLMWLFMTVYAGFSQVEESNADMTAEINTDAFQEHFFEALKQKGIENYDKAINALLACKKLDAENEVVDYELGLNYMEQLNFLTAQQYLEIACAKDPENKWYLDALFSCLLKQHNYQAAVPIAERLVVLDADYYKDLAEVYMELGQKQQAMTVIEKMESEGIDLRAAAQLKYKMQMRSKINALTESEEQQIQDVGGPVEDYQKQIEKQLERTDYGEALRFSSEAIDNFPTQPIFYLYKGRSLNKLQKYELATQILEEGLTYIVDDQELENNFYRELIVAYKALDAREKINHYQELIKN